MYAARVIPRDVYARRSRRSLPPGNNVARCQRECKRGSALAYCLKLLIGLRSDGAFPRYAVLLSLSFSFSFCLCFSLSRIHHLPTFPLSSASSTSARLRLPRCLLSTTPDHRSRSGKRRGCAPWLLRKVPMEFQGCTPRRFDVDFLGVNLRSGVICVYLRQKLIMS